MSSEDKESVELFIPIRRRSRASSDETVSTSESVTTSTPSATSSSFTPTTEYSEGRTTEVKATNNRSVFIPSSGVRYTVSAPLGGAHSSDYLSGANKTSAKTADTWTGLHGGQRPAQPSSLVGFKLNPASDIVHGVRINATRRLSDCGSRALDSKPTTLVKPREQILPVRTIPPSTFPGTAPAFEENRRGSIGMSSTRPVAHFATTTTTAGSPEPKFSSSPKSSIRTHSPESSHSSRDRTYPPGSFPDSFYQNRVALYEGSSDPAKITDRPPAMLKRRSNKSVYTISNTAILDSDNPDSHSGTIAASNFSEKPSPAFNYPRLERSASDRIVVRVNRTPYTIPPNLSRSISSSSQKSVFHETIHHYEGCVHTCPPTTRPLDIQPVIKHQRTSSYSSNLSAYSVIEGSCFDCDTSSRRDAETRILLTHAPELSELIAETRCLLGKLETEDPTVIVQDRDSADLPTPRDRDEDVITESFELQIQQIEARIQQLTELRDRGVKSVWRGYTSRWGPGTLGVVRDPSNARSRLSFGNSTSTIQTVPTTPDTQLNRTTSIHRRDRSRDSTGSRTTNATTTTMFREGETPEGRMRVNWIRD